MTCERNKKQTEERPESFLVAWWHRLRCRECRQDHKTDRLIDRGAAQLRCDSVPAASLSQTLAAVGISPDALSVESQRRTRRALGRALALVGMGIFVTTLAQPEQIGRSLFRAALPTGNVVGFWALLALFWYLKPLAALVLESVPGLLSHRRLCLIGSVVAATVLWLGPWLSAHTHAAFTPLLGVGLNGMLALASTILGGYLVEQAQQIGASGRLGALHQAASHLGAMAAPLFGLAVGRMIAPPVAAALLVAFGLMTFLIWPKDNTGRDKQKTDLDAKANPSRRPAGVVAQIAVIGKAHELWHVALMLFLVLGVSSFDALLTRQQMVQGFGEEQRIHLAWLAQAATLVSILFYIVLCRRVRLQALLPAGIFANAGGTLLYLAYSGPLKFETAAGIEIINGLASALILVTLFDLAVRAVPRGCAYLGYAVLMSISNLARAFSEIVTSSLHLGFSTIVILSAVSCSLAFIVLPRLPAALVTRREGETAARFSALLPAGGE